MKITLRIIYYILFPSQNSLTLAKYPLKSKLNIGYNFRQNQNKTCIMKITYLLQYYGLASAKREKNFENLINNYTLRVR